MKTPLQSITTDFHKQLWNPFVHAVKTYSLIEPGDKIAVCVSGGKDSMLLALLMQQLARTNAHTFSLRFLLMDPGYTDEHRALLIENAKNLGIPLEIFRTNVLSVVDKQEKHPCFLCARMRRGHLYAEAQKLGCNKIALGHHFNDVIETTLMGMLYGGQLQGMRPKRTSDNYPEMELIRPLYCVKERDILAWTEKNALTFLTCGCAFTATREADSRRKRTKDLIAALEAESPGTEKRIFNSIHTVQLDSLVRYKQGGVWHEV
ncbi:MAG: tRNA 2-thiocytidine biosynthesis protein TtcA [Ruminococcus sp.]|nr:tRNA 2-thiocytidine biosynthesis protein TtcA [Ruminococcus sp.]